MGKSYRDIKGESDKFEKRNIKRALKDKMNYEDFEEYKPKNKKR